MKYKKVHACTIGGTFNTVPKPHRVECAYNFYLNCKLAILVSISIELAILAVVFLLVLFSKSNLRCDEFELNK